MPPPVVATLSSQDVKPHADGLMFRQRLDPLTKGEKFAGPTELKALLLQQKDEFARNLAEKMLSYALGRGLEPYDTNAVSKITDSLKQNGYRSDALILGIVESYPFQYRKGSMETTTQTKSIAIASIIGP